MCTDDIWLDYLFDVPIVRHGDVELDSGAATTKKTGSASSQLSSLSLGAPAHPPIRHDTPTIEQLTEGNQHAAAVAATGEHPLYAAADQHSRRGAPKSTPNALRPTNSSWCGASTPHKRRGHWELRGGAFVVHPPPPARPFGRRVGKTPMRPQVSVPPRTPRSHMGPAPHHATAPRYRPPP